MAAYQWRQDTNSLSDSESRCERRPQTETRHRQFYSCHCRCYCHCVNGFPDSPVCISVSQLSCGDFLILIAPLSWLHIAWNRGCWVKHVDHCNWELYSERRMEITDVQVGPSGCLLNKKIKKIKDQFHKYLISGQN